MIFKSLPINIIFNKKQRYIKITTYENIFLAKAKKKRSPTQK